MKNQQRVAATTKLFSFGLNKLTLLHKVYLDFHFMRPPGPALACVSRNALNTRTHTYQLREVVVVAPLQRSCDLFQLTHTCLPLPLPQSSCGTLWKIDAAIQPKRNSLAINSVALPCLCWGQVLYAFAIVVASCICCGTFQPIFQQISWGS